MNMHKRFVLIAFLVLLLPAALYLLAMAIAEARVRRNLTPQVRARYEAWKREPLNLPAPALSADPFTTETHNAALAFHESARTLGARARQLTTPPREKNKASFGELLADAEHIAAIKGQLDALTTLTAAFERLVERPDYRIEAEASGVYGPDGKMAGERASTPPYIDFGPIQSTARLMAYQSAALILDGRIAQGLAKAETIIKAARNETFSSRYCHLTAQSLYAIGLAAWSHAVDRCEAPALLRKTLEEANRRAAEYAPLPEDKYLFNLEAIGGLRWLKRQGCTPPDYGAMPGPELFQLHHAILAAYQERCALPNLAADARLQTEARALGEDLQGNRNLAFKIGPLRLTWSAIKAHPLQAMMAAASHDAERAIFFFEPGFTVQATIKKQEKDRRAELDKLRLKIARKLYRLQEGREAPDEAALVRMYLPEAPKDKGVQNNKPQAIRNGQTH